MSFKNLLAYKFEEQMLFSGDDALAQFEAALSERPLTPCLTQEMESLGWITCFKDSNYVEKINNALFVNLGIETRQLPDKAIKTAVEKRIEEKQLKNLSRSDYKELDEIELKELKDAGGNAKFKGVALDSKEVQDPLKEGWQVTKLAIEYDEQISFSLASDFIFKRLKFLEHFEENLDTEDDPILQMQSELYLAVDLYRRVISHTYDQVNAGR